MVAKLGNENEKGVNAIMSRAQVTAVFVSADDEESEKLLSEFGVLGILPSAQAEEAVY
jgi:hypothetical protein